MGGHHQGVSFKFGISGCIFYVPPLAVPKQFMVKILAIRKDDKCKGTVIPYDDSDNIAVEVIGLCKRIAIVDFHICVFHESKPSWPL